MKRVSTVCAIAALVATALPLSSATAQTWEIHQYFGTPTTSANPSPTGNPGVNPSITVSPGQTVFMPVFIQMQGGDSTATPQLLTSFLYGVSGVIVSGGPMTNFTPNAAGTATRAQGTYADSMVDLGNLYGNITGTNAPTGNFSLVNNMGFQSAPPGTTNIAGSRGFTLQPFDTANQAWWMGVVAISTAGATPNTVMDLYFRTGLNTTLSSAPYGTSDQTAGATTVAYGVNASGNPDFARFGTTAAVVGRAQNIFSSAADARITVIPVPEPGTLCLLSLGFLAMRRRRAC
jgi:hypothetical protein